MEKDNNIIDLRRFWRAVKQLKWLYVAAVLLMGGAAIWYVSRAIPKKPIVGEMLIGEESMTDGGAGALAAAKGAAGGMSQMLKTFSIGGFGGAAVDNEVLVLSSYDVMMRTVKALNLNRSYIGKTADGTKEMLWRNSPVLVEAPAEYFDTLSTNFNVKVKLLAGGKADIVATKGFLRRQIAKAEGVTLPAILKTPYGSLQILRGETFDSSPYKEVSIGVSGNCAAAIKLAEDIDIDVMTKLSDVIEINLEYANPELGKAIVDGVMAEYNAKRLDRIHETAVNSIKYYDERIAETLKQLESDEQKVADYQHATSMSAIEAEAKLIAGLSTEGKAKLIAAHHAKDYYQRVINALGPTLDTDVLLPKLDAVGDTIIGQYNDLIMKRGDLRRSATENNTAILLLNQEITTLSDLIKLNALQYIDKAQAEIDMQAGITGMANNRLNQYPTMEQEYTVLARNKEFQNALYLYLSQARENAVLKLFADTDLGYVFQPAYVAKPGLPVKSILLVVVAIVFGVFGCVCLSLLLMWRSQRIKAPMDVAFMGIDGNALNYDSEHADAIAHLRTDLLSNTARRILYCADFTGSSDAIGELSRSFEAAGYSVVLEAADTNEALVNPSFTRRLKTALGDGTIVLVAVPEPQRLFVLEHDIDAHDANLVIVVPQTMRRHTLRSLLKGQTACRVFTLIVKQ